MQTNGTAWPTAAELNDGTYNFEAKKSVLPYVAYQVSVAEAGVYEMKVGYIISGDKLATHKMLLYVNGLAYEAPYTKSAKNPAEKNYYSESSTQVALNAGENTVYCIPFDATYRAANSSAWLNHDYLEIGTKLDTPKAVSGLVSAGDRTALADIKDEMIPQFGENAYTAYAVWAPTAGTYTITANATGAGYPAMLVNGAVYTGSGAKEVNLNAGINIVYCLRIAGFSIQYTGLTIADELYAADMSCMVIPGDANGDRSVDVKDLVHAKKNPDKYIYAVDFDNNDTNVSNNTSGLRSVLLGKMKMLIKTPKTSTP